MGLVGPPSITRFGVLHGWYVMQDHTGVPPGGAGILARIYWMFVGNVLLLFILALIFERHPPFPAVLDAAYLSVVTSLVLVRYLDIRFLHGETGDGKPATLAHWGRYVMLITAAGTAAWFLARGMAHLLK